MNDQNLEVRSQKPGLDNPGRGELGVELAALSRDAATVKCPRCGRPVAKVDLVRGVCPECKRLLESAHGNILKPGFRGERPVSIPRKVKPQGFYNDQSELVATTADAPDGEGLIERYCQETGFNRMTGMMALQAAAQLLAGSQLSGSEVLLQVEQKLNDLRGLLERGFLHLQAYEKRHGDRMMAERCLWLLLNFPVLAGAGDFPGLVKLLAPRKKQTVNKCLQFFQGQMPELPLLPGQRDEKARKNMAASRREQLGKSKAQSPENYTD